MKSIAATVFLLSSIAGTMAAPSGAKVPRQNSCPSAGDITVNINGWQNDINSVNGFLNTVPSLTTALDISNGAVNALIAAEDGEYTHPSFFSCYEPFEARANAITLQNPTASTSSPSCAAAAP